MTDTIVVNLYAGPGAGKSTTAAGVFYELKTQGYNCELVTEFAKDLTWSGHQKTLGNALYVSGVQYERMKRLLGEVDIIITDSPILLSAAYMGEKYAALRYVLQDLHRGMNTLNFFVNRTKRYNPKGRNQTEEQARELDGIIRKLVEGEFNQTLIDIEGNELGVDFITGMVEHEMKRWRPIE